MGFLEKIYVALIKKVDGDTVLCWSLHESNAVQISEGIMRDDSNTQSITIYEVNADELITTTLNARFDAGYFNNANEDLDIVKRFRR